MSPLSQALARGNGRLTPALFNQAKRRRIVASDANDKFTASLLANLKRKKMDCPSPDPPLLRKRKKAEGTNGMMYVMNPDGSLRHGKPHDSLWWVNYACMSKEDLTRRQLRKFRRRFRMPFEEWKKFVEVMNTHELFVTWRRGKRDCCKKLSSPIELLSLGALRYLGRKCTFDDLEEWTFISERTHERFFEKFIQYGATTLFDKYVLTPSTPDEIKSHMKEMMEAGFPGGGGSTDATNVIIINCRYGLRQIHLGHKLSKTARGYNITVNHRRRILATTSGHPSRWNDKTIVLFDDFIVGLHDGCGLDDYIFFLLERDENGDIRKVEYHGVWVLVDNGYLAWSVTIPPYKYTNHLSEIRWSQWLESMRKDVECTFGILKSRWTILDKGVQARKIENADQVWKTCCALHNMLLEIDGYDEIWEGAIPSDPDVGNSTCFAINRLNNPLQFPRPEVAPEETNIDDVMSGYDDSGTTPRIVRDLNQDFFRKRLVEHFDILFEQHKIVWPSRVRIPRSV